MIIINSLTHKHYNDFVMIFHHSFSHTLFKNPNSFSLLILLINFGENFFDEEKDEKKDKQNSLFSILHFSHLLTE